MFDVHATLALAGVSGGRFWIGHALIGFWVACHLQRTWIWVAGSLYFDEAPVPPLFEDVVQGVGTPAAVKGADEEIVGVAFDGGIAPGSMTGSTMSGVGGGLLVGADALLGGVLAVGGCDAGVVGVLGFVATPSDQDHAKSPIGIPLHVVGVYTFAKSTPTCQILIWVARSGCVGLIADISMRHIGFCASSTEQQDHKEGLVIHFDSVMGRNAD